MLHAVNKQVAENAEKGPKNATENTIKGANTMEGSKQAIGDFIEG